MRREEATRPFEIALQGDVSWTILRAVREIEGEQLETGAYLLALGIALLEGSQGNTVAGNVLRGNGQGFFLIESTDNVVR